MCEGSPAAPLRTIVARAIIALTVMASAARADLLADGQAWREIPFEVVDQKPMLAAQIGDVSGRMMFDTGTPEMLFLNRDALPLSDGQGVGNGFAASGQPIEVRLHDAPAVQIGGLPLAIAPKVVSGDFSFVEGLFGTDYLGFVGLPAVEGGAFLLDYQRRVLTILRSDAGGTLAVPLPAARDVVASLTFALIPGEQPTTGAFVGSLPVALDFDTGDSGTFYLRPETRARLLADGTMVATDDAAVLAKVTFGGATFAGLAIRLVEAGGAGDKRPWPGSDALRLGAAFLAENPSLWNIPAGTITILRPDAAFLAPR
jgi:hypothetical protein